MSVNPVCSYTGLGWPACQSRRNRGQVYSASPMNRWSASGPALSRLMVAQMPPTATGVPRSRNFAAMICMRSACSV